MMNGSVPIRINPRTVKKCAATAAALMPILSRNFTEMPSTIIWVTKFAVIREDIWVTVMSKSRQKAVNSSGGRLFTAAWVI